MRPAEGAKGWDGATRAFSNRGDGMGFGGGRAGWSGDATGRAADGAAAFTGLNPVPNPGWAGDAAGAAGGWGDRCPTGMDGGWEKLLHGWPAACNRQSAVRVAALRPWRRSRPACPAVTRAHAHSTDAYCCYCCTCTARAGTCITQRPADLHASSRPRARMRSQEAERYGRLQRQF